MNLAEKAVDIKGKKYVLVSDRVLFFNETYPNGCIKTEYSEDENRVTFKATVIPDTDKPNRVFNGYSQAVWGDGLVNKSSALENAETSAVGRALGFMGIGVIESIASADEIKKAETNVATTGKSGTFCSLCGEEGLISHKSGRDYCPNWKEHKENGERTTMLKTKKEQSFAAGLGEIPIIQVEDDFRIRQDDVK